MVAVCRTIPKFVCTGAPLPCDRIVHDPVETRPSPHVLLNLVAADESVRDYVGLLAKYDAYVVE